MERTLKDYLLLSLKGICMGAADVVPGVSGGTIAFIVGIYDELIDSIKSINAQSLKKLFTGHPAVFWRMINGNFLFFLLLGIGISVFSLAKLITWLLVAYPVLVWAFFFGLVLASTWFVGKDIKTSRDGTGGQCCLSLLGRRWPITSPWPRPWRPPHTRFSSSCAGPSPFVP